MQIRRPLVWLLAAYLAGMGVYRLEFLFIQISAFIGMSVILLILWLIRKKGKEKLISHGFLIIMPFLFIAGYCRMQHQMKPAGLDTVFHKRIGATVNGQLESIENKGDYISLTLKKSTITIDNKSNTNPYSIYRVIVYTKQKADYKIGNHLSVKGQLIKFQKSSNPGQFNEYQYYKIQSIDYKVNAETIQVIDQDYSLFYHLLYAMKVKMVQIYEEILPSKDSGIMSAMILGEMSLLDSEIKELYRQNGISHILSISGLNVSLLGIALFTLLRKIRIPILPATLISIFFLFSYGVLTNFSVSTNRAVVMLILRMLADVIGRTYDLLSAVSLSALIILFQSPMQIMNAGFLLSFTAILGISLLYPVLSNFFAVKNFILDAFWLSLSIQIFTTPIILFYFYELPVYSIVVNMLILPLSSLLMLMAVTALIVGCFCLPAAVFLIGSVHYILVIYETICRLASELPGKALFIGQPDIANIIAFYFVIITFIFVHKKIQRKFSIILLSFSFILFVKSKNVNLIVTFLDVGQGDGIFMEMPGGRTYLIDGGSADVKMVGKYRLEPFLKANGCWKVDYAVVTHPDTDHISGLMELINNIQFGDSDRNWYLGKIIIRHLIVPNITEPKEELTELITMAKERGIEVIYLEKGDIIEDGDVRITCLNPCPDTVYSSANAFSTVLSVSYHQFDLLLTGDLEGEGESLVTQELLKGLHQKSSFSDAVATGYDVLKVAHHGSKYSTLSDFLYLTKPEYSIISCGEDNRYGHPHKELLERLELVDSQVEITYETGAITIWTDGERMVVERFLEGIN